MRWLELKIPPPVVLLVVGSLMWLAARLVPALSAPVPARTPIAVVLALVGVGLGIGAAVGFRRAHTTINPMRPDGASALVHSGLYRFSRNPIYLGDLLVLVGWGVWLSNLLSLLLSALFVFYIDRFQIAPEERALARRFGAAFDEYRARVRRWV